MILTDKGTREVTSTHAVDIFAFVEAQEIPFHYFETPYYLAPVPGGEKVYALLRETLRRTRKIGIAYVVIQMRRHLAALVPYGKALVLNTLRCASEVRRLDAVGDMAPQQFAETEELNESELAAVAQLIDSMTQQWDTLPHELDGLRDAAAWNPAKPGRIANTIELEELLDLTKQAGVDGELMDKWWGRPHRRAARHLSRTTSGAQRGAMRGQPRNKVRR